MTSIIDQNNRDYDFCHNRTALIGMHLKSQMLVQRYENWDAAYVFCSLTVSKGSMRHWGVVWCRRGELVARQVKMLRCWKTETRPLVAFKLQGLVSAVISYLSKHGCEQSLKRTAVCTNVWSTASQDWAQQLLRNTPQKICKTQFEGNVVYK